MHVPPAAAPPLLLDNRRTPARQDKFRKTLTIVAFVLPALLVYVLFVLYPIVQAMLLQPL